MASKKAIKKPIKKAVKKPVKKVTKKQSKPIKKASNCLAGFYYQIEQDSNYPDNANITLIKKALWDSEKKIDENWTKEEQQAIDALVDKLLFDIESVLPCIYSFDILTQDMVRNELNAVGMSELIETSSYVPDFSEPKEEPEDPSGCGGCNGTCGTCGQTP